MAQLELQWWVSYCFSTGAKKDREYTKQCCFCRSLGHDSQGLQEKNAVGKEYFPVSISGFLSYLAFQ